MILSYQDLHPSVGEHVFIAPNAYVIGDVELADHVSIFFGAVLRGDIQPIRVGARSNIQEHSVLHTSREREPTIIAADVTVGHRAMIHSATVEERCLVGMGAIILDGAVIGAESLIGAGAVVTEGKKIPPRSLVIGTPGRVVRTLGDEEVAKFNSAAENYVKVGSIYKAMELG